MGPKLTGGIQERQERMLRNYKITVSYDGTRYNGWQKQKNTEATIQGKLEQILYRLSGRETAVHGAGRTDAGVHALGQTANFRLDTALSEAELLDYFNRYLPDDIAVLSLKPASERFHSRLSAVGKVYRYRSYTGKAKPVFWRKYRCAGGWRPGFVPLVFISGVLAPTAVLKKRLCAGWIPSRSAAWTEEESWR